LPAFRARINLDLIEPGDRTSSFLYQKLTGEQGAFGGNQMPQGAASLDAVTLERIGLWIDGLTP
jgi:hypothetical protein